MKNLTQLGISPAPWIRNDYNDVYDSQGVGVVYSFDESHLTKEDACLIAAAPELYEALRNTLVALYNRLPSQPTLDELEIVDRAATALARASGESEGDQ